MTNLIAIIIVVVCFSIIYIIDLYAGCKLWIKPNPKHMKPTKWGWIVWHPENLKLGDLTDIGYGTYINAEYGVDIGNNVQIGGGCKIYSKDTISGTCGNVIIMPGAKIGANSVILPGSVIGENAVVGALSVVKGKIGDNETFIMKRRCTCK